MVTYHKTLIKKIFGGTSRKKETKKKKKKKRKKPRMAIAKLFALNANAKNWNGKCKAFCKRNKIGHTKRV